jgi:hypothetical protein
MNRELLELRARMEALECLLADQAAAERRPGRRGYATPAVCAVLSLANVLLLLDGAAVRLGAAAPSNVSAPFTVVDDKGHALMSVEADAGGGRLAIYNADSRAVASLGATSDGSSAHLDVYARADDEPKVILGINEEENGSLRLAGFGKGVMYVTGSGAVVTNSERRPAAILRADGAERGYLQLRNKDGATTTSVWASDAGGILEVNDKSGKPAGKIDALAGPGKMTVFGNGAERTGLGVSADDAGLIVLKSVKGSEAMFHGNGVLRTTNPAGKNVIELGIDPKGNGILDVRHSSGTGGVRLDVSDGGTGNVKIHSLDYDIRAQLGVKDGNKGDVCVMGSKGLDCLSLTFVKLLIPW